ncbi:hypothetical protein ACIQU6_44365 [Streptomyces sp. NPDC090442]|uniref:hypothetical protein n=1 Tax=Streptomyces sp. NPDC090442 TaxID=3365962 RepID=UPI00380807A4
MGRPVIGIPQLKRPPAPSSRITATNNRLVRKRNRIIAVTLDPVIRAFLAPDSIYLKIPSGWMLPPDPSQAEAVEQARSKTVPEARGVFTTDHVPSLIATWVGAYLVGDGSILILNRTIVGSYDDAEVLFPLRAADYTLSEDRLTLTAANLRGTFTVDRETLPGGRTQLTPRSTKKENRA